jgi:hypothetical protein
MKIVVSLAGVALFLTVLTVIQASAEERRRLLAVSNFHNMYGGAVTGNKGNRYCPNGGWIGQYYSCDVTRLRERLRNARVGAGRYGEFTKP